MRRGSVCLGLVLMLWVTPGIAQTVSSIHVVPVVAHTTGAGDPPTYWLSDLTIHNPNESAVTVAVAFGAEGVENRFEQITPVILQIAAGSTLAYEDVLASLFEVTDNLKGVLLIDAGYIYSLGNPPGTGVLVTSRTYNTGDPRGTFGQTVPSASLSMNFTDASSIVTGARFDDRYRSNLGIVNVSPESVLIYWEAFDADGQSIGSGSKTMLAFSMGQWSFSDLGIGSQQGPITLRLWMDSANVTPDPCATLFANGFIAYVSKVDGNPNGTGDGELLQAVPMSVPGCWLDELF